MSDPIDVQRRQELIKNLIRLEFPLANAPPPLGSGSADVESWQRAQDARTARSDELWKMADEQLAQLSKQVWSRELERDRLRREKQTPPAKEPDWRFWTGEDEWELRNAALLLVNLEPRAELGRHLKQHAPEDGLSDEARAKLRTVEEIIRRAHVAYEKGKLDIEFSQRIGSAKASVEPRPFLLWARDKGYELPSALLPLIADECSRSELERKIGQLQAELDQSLKLDEAGPHYPPELDVALQAWRAVSNQTPSSSKTVRQRLEDWIRTTYPKLTRETVKRIATVASWDKQRGRKGGKQK